MVGDATHNPSTKHAPPGITAKIRLQQRPRHAREGGCFHCKSKRWDQAHERSNMCIRKAIGARRSPRGIETIHLANGSFRPEAADHGNVVSHACGPELRKDWKLGFAFRREAAAQRAFASLQQVKKRTCLPTCDCLG